MLLLLLLLLLRIVGGGEKDKKTNKKKSKREDETNAVRLDAKKGGARTALQLIVTVLIECGDRRIRIVRVP